jgi:hypothetical protein
MEPREAFKAQKSCIVNESEEEIKYLETLGVQAYILPDIIFGTLIVIATKDYALHHRKIDARFKVVRQIGKHSYFQVRLHCSGNTI